MRDIDSMIAWEDRRIRRKQRKSIRIEAPAEVAAALIALLDGLGGVLRARDSSSASGEG